MPKPPARKLSASSENRVVGLRDIAEDLNVSISLVSKVLSGRLGNSGANKGLIQAIHEKADELDYRKNHLAEALRTGRQNAIGVLIRRHGTAGSAIVDEMVGGIAAAATRNGQRLVLQFYTNVDEFRTFSRGLRRNVVDAVIMGGLPNAELLDDLKKIQASGVPVVTIHDRHLAGAYPNVGIDQHEVTRLSTLHLIDDCHCKRPAHFRTKGQLYALSTVRAGGYLAALEERGIPFDPQLLLEVDDFRYESGQEGARRLLELGIEFDGIVGQSDEHAVGALNALVLAGIKVPQQVKITGVDNAPICNCAIVPTTSVSQEFQRRGEMAVDLLMSALKGNKIESVYIDPVVRVRASSNPLAENSHARA